MKAVGVITYKPDKVGEVGSGRFIRDELEHCLILHLKHVQAEGPHRNSHHALAVVKKLNGLRVQGEIMRVLVIKEVDGVLVEPEGERLEERDVVGHHLLVGEVELVDDDRIDVIVGQQIVDGRLVADILKQDVERLQQLNADVVISRLLVHDFQKVGEHVPFQKEVKDRAVVLVAPDQDLGDGTEGFDEKALVTVCDHLVLSDDGIEVLQVVQRVRVFRPPYAAEQAAVSEHFIQLICLIKI